MQRRTVLQWGATSLALAHALTSTQVFAAQRGLSTTQLALTWMMEKMINGCPFPVRAV